SQPLSYPLVPGFGKLMAIELLEKQLPFVFVTLYVVIGVCANVIADKMNKKNIK
ncbi:MAG: hypothetical protein RL335_112, partial [Bacteroidota bacterium]